MVIETVFVVIAFIPTSHYYPLYNYYNPPFMMKDCGANFDYLQNCSLEVLSGAAF